MGQNWAEPLVALMAVNLESSLDYLLAATMVDCLVALMDWRTVGMLVEMLVGMKVEMMAARMGTMSVD